MRLLAAIALVASGAAHGEGLNCGYYRDVMAEYLAKCAAHDGCTSRQIMQRQVDEECGVAEPQARTVPDEVLPPSPPEPRRSDPATVARKKAKKKKQEFTVTIHRQYSDDHCTSGYLAVNGEIVAYTLERPWRGNRPLISSIPAGVYSGTIRYDHSDQWRIELVGVPSRSVVQIHTGNTPDDSEGCILVGKSLGPDLCHVISSHDAYDGLRTAFYGSPNPNATPNTPITVIVSGGGQLPPPSRKGMLP